MCKLSDHKTQYGFKTTVFKMSSSHIKNCINLWSFGLAQNKYQRPDFIKNKINLYNKILLKRL